MARETSSEETICGRGNNREDISVLTLHMQVELLFFLKVYRRDNFLVDATVFVQMMNRLIGMNTLGR